MPKNIIMSNLGSVGHLGFQMSTKSGNARLSYWWFNKFPHVFQGSEFVVQISHRWWTELYQIRKGHGQSLAFPKHFLPRCMECRRGLAMRILSVCLSVRPSVRHTRGLWQNGRKICPDLCTIWKNI